MLEVYKNVWGLLNHNEKNKALTLLLLMTIMAIVEVIGVGSIIPFLAVLGNPDIIQTNGYLLNIYNYLDFDNTYSFLLFLGISAFFILLLSAGVKTLTSYRLFRFSNMRRHNISQKLLSKYLCQPYSYFLTKNSSDITKTILSETDLVISQIIMPILNLTVQSIITVLLVSFLILVDPILAFIVFFVLGGFYIVMYTTISKYIARIGKERTLSNAQRFKICFETIGGIKDIKILGKEQVYLDSFKAPSFTFSDYSSKYQTLSQVPQYLVEALGFGAILTMAVYALGENNSDIANLLPILGLYTLGALKLKPAINNIYSSVTTIKFGISGLDVLLKDLQEKSLATIDIRNDNKRLKLKKVLKIENLSFSYKDSNKRVLNGINLTIDVNTTIGITGTTGAGKSTLVDIILGLLSPSNGRIIVDDRKLTKYNIRQWQNSIGYVPQSIFLSDDTIASNIAFGITKDKINLEQIKKVSKMAQIDTFIEDLENGYDTEVGERGVRLSGGQRQRLGIARALYNNPDLLVLDEATSALDNDTEIEVMKTIENLSGSKTIIMIAHRRSTIEKCDVIIKIDKGEILEKRQ
jgi:ABC-type bacteriocin/lantibiotic exporter with double-glycine peptidase domain